MLNQTWEVNDLQRHDVAETKVLTWQRQNEPRAILSLCVWTMSLYIGVCEAHIPGFASPAMPNNWPKQYKKHDVRNGITG